jgi:asparagine synthase (glutamine-hydrolysing)
MCGIAGILYADPLRIVEPELLANMNRALAHRGPDGEGVWTGDGIGLVHRRLAIIDLETGHQPMSSSDGAFQVVFNGEIYNYRELRHRLESQGHSFRTHSDTEVLLHLYRQQGVDMVSALRGMFAFALWDARTRQLLLARDRVGIKPLYVFRDDHCVVFASELKALLATPFVSRDVDIVALEDYLTFGMVQGEHSILADVRRLRPGSIAVVRQDKLSVSERRYWSLKMRPDPGWTEASAAEAVRAKVGETVRAHMVADVAVGAFLSGGIDSGIMVGLAADGAASSSLQTFSIGFHEEEFSELSEARATARKFGTDHHEEIVTAGYSISLVEELTRYFDEPFADPSAVPTYLVSRLAARTVKVALSGDGGDEAFGGYNRYREDLREWRARTTLPSSVRAHLIAPLAAHWPKADWLPRPLRAKTFLENVAAVGGGAAYANSLAICRTLERRKLLAAGVRQLLNGYDPGILIEAAYNRTGDSDPVAAMIGADVEVHLPDDYLTKVDRASMAHGLEVRPVFVDHELLELTATVPSRLKVRGGSTKWLLRRMYRDFLPPGASSRPKQGFSVPVDAWFRGPLNSMFQDTVLNNRGPITDFIDLAAAGRLFQRHSSGLTRHGTSLWSIMMLARWCDTYLVAPAREPASPLIPHLR